MNTLTQFKNTTILPVLIALMLGCFGLSPQARAVDPPPDGGYPNDNTAEGDNALANLDTRTGAYNTAIGHQALFSITTSSGNTAVGDLALFADTIGIQNTAVGWFALSENVDGTDNVASGISALGFNTSGGENTATGAFALEQNRMGNNNTASGALALGNPDGSNNTATGAQAMLGDAPDVLPTAHDNTADGAFALQNITTGNFNVASGVSALFTNSTGSNNVANGFQALYSNTIGFANTAIGVQALFSNTTGSGNTANGVNALYNNTTGSSNIALGVSAGFNLTTGNNNIDIGHFGVAGESKRIRIGTAGTHARTFIAGIRGVTTQNANAIPVLIDSAGQLGTMSSSRRFKKKIKPMDQTSEAILGLRPVTFHYKSDNTGTPQFGLIAEEVAEVNPDLVVHDENGEIYTVRYEAVNAMLLNEFLKEHRKNEEQQAMIARLEKQIEALTAGLQKVSAQVELSKSAPQTVLNNQ